ncbi:hypothetical protein HMPREF9555_01909 [Selenomonas artemidis F0399]|uniref:Uncharacterized protein n=1 Tax=Selenomonas artemidis F0399 TaxID=749551 RepID=E7N4G4_9FIRM|nr:hypothetical protein HMPREF9555_01909 [Selenomonas artemidis F0399]
MMASVPPPIASLSYYNFAFPSMKTDFIAYIHPMHFTTKWKLRIFYAIILTCI